MRGAVQSVHIRYCCACRGFDVCVFSVFGACYILAIQDHQRPRAMHLGEVQVELVALPPSTTGHRLSFALRPAAVRPTQSSSERTGCCQEPCLERPTMAPQRTTFPHVVVALNADMAALDQTVDSQVSLRLRPCTAFSIRGNDLSQNTWEAVVRRRRA